MNITAGAKLTRHYANQVTQEKAQDYANAADSNLATYATLYTGPGVLLSWGSYSNWVEVKFPSMVPANTPAYVALSGIDGNRLLDFLLGGSVGGLLKDVFGALFTGTPHLTVKAKNGNNEVKTIELTPGGSGGGYGVEIGPDGLFYLKITPNSNYDRVFIELWTSFTVFGAPSGINGNPSIQVRDVFYNSGIPFDCDKDFVTTTYDGTGLSANILLAQGKPVKNPHFAIDDDKNTYSEIGYNSVVNLGIGTTAIQRIYFNRLSNPGEEAVIELNQTSSLLTLSLFNAITVSAYDGDRKVYESNLGSIIDGDLLGIFSNIFGTTRPKRISIPVGAQFDRIDVSFAQLVSAGVLSNTQINLYGVYQAPVKPKLAHSAVLETCGENMVTLGVSAPVLDVTYTWFNSSLQQVHTGATYDVMAPVSGDADTFFVTSSRCNGKYSEYVPVVVKGNDAVCNPSAITGKVDVSAYASDSTVYVVLVNDSNKVVGTVPVDPVTGNYKFQDVAKGNYKIALVSGSVPPVVGSTIPGSNLGTDYTVNPGTRNVKVSGTGDPVAVDGFVIEFNGPDLKTSLTAPGTSVLSGKILQLTYRVFNVGKTGTKGAIDVVISKPTTGTLTVGPLPNGVTMSSTPESIFLKITDPILVGLTHAITIPATYTAPGSIGTESLTVTIPVGHGGGEKNSSNNSSSVRLLLNQ